MHSIYTPKGSAFSLLKYLNPAYFQNIEKSDIPLTAGYERTREILNPPTLTATSTLSDGNVRYLAADMLQRCRIQTVNKFFLEKPALNCIFEYFRHYNNLLERGHEKMCLVSYVNKKGTDQPAHVRSLIGAFVVRFLDSIISLDSIAEISRL